jgi:hypothetical protein
MSNEISAVLTEAAVFRGELHRILLSLGIVLLIMLFVLAVEAWHERSTGMPRQFGLWFLGMTVCAAVLLFAVWRL